MSGWWVLWYVLIMIVAMVGVVIAGTFAGMEMDPDALDRFATTSDFSEIPTILLLAFGAITLVALHQLYLLGFKRGTAGPNRYDRGAQDHDGDGDLSPPPWQNG